MLHRLRLAQIQSLAFMLSAMPIAAVTHGQTPSPTVAEPETTVIRIESAQVFCDHKINVAAQSDGLIDTLHVDEGDSVKKGDTLLMIDARVADAELQVATKELEAADMQAQQTANIKYAEAAAEVSKEEYDAEVELWNKGATTWSVLKRKQLEAQRAILGVDVAKVEHEKEILAADVAREKLKAAEVRLGLFKVVAPYDGVIVQRLHDQGEWIRSGDPVLRLVSLSEMKVETLVPVDGISVASLEGAPAKVHVRINSQQVANYDAKVDFVSPEIEHRRVRISIRIQNEQVLGSWLLRDGMIATIEIEAQR